ncbi:MAG: SET domain-containing protein [Gemmatimonadales bacterium]
MKPDAKVLVLQGHLGRGIHARLPISAGKTILEFDGPIASHDEILAMGEAQAYALQVGPDRYIDTRPPGRFTNHSCEPNAGIAGDHLLVGLRDIGVGEEIQFDYSTTMSENHWTMDCRCSRSRCRRTIGDFHLLPFALQAHYVGLGVVQSFIVREWQARLAASHRTISPARFMRVRRAEGF